ncbi:hypothetical protein L1887_05517 [Cichorium endivia]|nr:hypothetical protein L1887_05517 [Cichorium endivia]
MQNLLICQICRLAGGRRYTLKLERLWKAASTILTSDADVTVWRLRIIVMECELTNQDDLLNQLRTLCNTIMESLQKTFPNSTCPRSQTTGLWYSKLQEFLEWMLEAIDLRLLRDVPLHKAKVLVEAICGRQVSIMETYFSKFQHQVEFELCIMIYWMMERKLQSSFLEVTTFNRRRRYLQMRLLSRIHRRNLVKIYGFCQEGKGILVYEFLHNGNLKKHPYGPIEKKQRIKRVRRLEMAQESAKVLFDVISSSSLRQLGRAFQTLLMNIMGTDKSTMTLNVLKKGKFGIFWYDSQPHGPSIPVSINEVLRKTIKEASMHRDLLSY